MEVSSEKKLKFTYDNHTIDHLGVKLYSTIPPMLAELVSNAWDADAHNVYIDLQNGEDKQICVRDDGEGMSFEELNYKFLKIGRNRRAETHCNCTSLGRPVLGKKGLGKLSMFGIGHKIIVTSIKDGKKNSFLMDYDKIKEASEGVYEPELLCVDEITTIGTGTSIEIKDLNRKSDFDLESIEQGIRSRFRIFSDDFIVHIGDKIEIKNCTIPDNIYQFSWEFPKDYKEAFEDNELFRFGVDRRIKGTIYTSSTPLKGSMQGIALFSRSKLVQENRTFDKRGNDNFFLYMTGSFDVDFVDEDDNVDNCSTDRKSLAWDNYDNDDLIKLNDLLEKVVGITQTKWRKQRKEAKKEIIKRRGIEIDKWIESLNRAEKPMARKLVDAIVENDDISQDQTASYIEDIKEMYGFQSFKDFAAELSEMDKLDDKNAIKLLTDWQEIEAKEYARIASGRLETINQFEKYILEDASETKVIQKFLEEFPWLLDPKMASFEREVTYSKLLKENFPDNELDERDRRLDFLCTNDSGVMHIIELKRPSIKITEKQLKQISDYMAFMENHLPANVTSVEGCLISDHMAIDAGTQRMIEGMKFQKIFVKSYSDLLAEARRYNQKFYKIHEELEEAKK